MRAWTATSAPPATSCRTTIPSASPTRSAWHRRCCPASSDDMSLLLDALKKAEKAKEEAQRRTGDEQRAAAPLQLQEEAQAKPVTTRRELPDISKPLEILSDDIAPKGAAGAAEPRSPSAASERRAASRGT